MTRDIDSPDYSDFSCDSGRDTPAEREVAVLRERAEKAEAEKQAEFDIAQQERRFADDARRERDEAREDIKALAEVVSIWRAGVSLNLDGATWQRIRDRRLLEVSDGRE